MIPNKKKDKSETDNPGKKENNPQITVASELVEGSQAVAKRQAKKDQETANVKNVQLKSSLKQPNTQDKQKNNLKPAQGAVNKQNTQPIKLQSANEGLLTPARKQSSVSSAKLKQGMESKSRNASNSPSNKVAPEPNLDEFEASSEALTSAIETSALENEQNPKSLSPRKNITKSITKNLSKIGTKIGIKKKSGPKQPDEQDKMVEEEILPEATQTIPKKSSKKRRGRIASVAAGADANNADPEAPSTASKYTEIVKQKMKRQLEAEQFDDEIKKRLKDEKDQNGMNAFHRAATDHNLLLVQEMLEIDAQLEQDKRLWINSESRYGETPLLISSMLKDSGAVDGRNPRRDEFIDFLLDNGALVNITNKHTLWSPSHWAARHGDEVLLQKLLDKHATPFTPDAKGFFPIDYAGKFEHWGIVQKLIEVSLKFFKDLQEKEKNPQLDPFRLNDQDTQQLLKTLLTRGLAPERSDTLYDKADVFLLSPIYATSLLYWGSMVKTVTVEQISTILFEMESYPEAVTALPSQLKRTTCHAVALGGSTEKMEMIYDEFYERWKNTQATLNNISFKLSKTSVHAPFKKEPKVKKRLNFEIPLQFRKLKQMKDFWTNSFWPGMFHIHGYKDAPISRIQDRDKNTPLHLAALNNNEKSVVKLLTKYQCAIDVRNAEGVMAKDIGGWHEKIGAIFKDFYAEFDKTMGGPVGEDKDEWYSTEIAQSFQAHREKVDPSTDTELLRRLVEVASTSNKKQQGIISDILKARSQVPIQPQVVLKLVATGPNFLQKHLGACFGAGHARKVQRKRLNDFIKQMDATEFQIGIFQGVDADTFLVLVDLPEDEIEREAQTSAYPVKLLGMSAKVPFQSSLKKRVQPFKSKDIQSLIIQKLERMFDLHKLRVQGILQAVVPMHEDQSLWYIDEKYQKPAKCIPHSFSTFKAFFREDFEDTRFSDVNAYMHYFGEKKGIINTFFEFCTIYLLVPAIISAGIAAYQKYVLESESILTVFYAIFVAVWTTYMIECWKRKEHHIAYKWGAVNTTTLSDEVQENPNYMGYESFSWSNYATSRKNPSRWGNTFLVINFLVVVIFIVSSVSAYVGLKNYATTGMPAWKKTLVTGVLLTGITGTMSFLYKFVAQFFVTKENHKYQKNKDRSFMLKMVSFSLVNSHLTVLYALVRILTVEEGDEDYVEDKYSYINGIILSAVLSKAADPLVTRYFWRFGKFQIARIRYFWAVSGRAKEQQLKHQTYEMSKLPAKDAALLQEKEKISFFRGMFNFNIPEQIVNTQAVSDTHEAEEAPGIQRPRKATGTTKIAPAETTLRQTKASTQAPGDKNGPQNKQKPAQAVPGKPAAAKQQAVQQSRAKQTGKAIPTYQRFVFNNDNGDGDCIENEQVLLDSVEINARMPIKSEIYITNDITSRFLMLSFGMLYAGICPLATLVVFIYFLIDISLMRLTDMYCVQRPIARDSQTIGPWIAVAEMMIGAVIVVNSVMLYLLSTTLNEDLEERGLSETGRIWVIIAVEHFIFFMLILIKVGIQDLPRKILKLRIRTQTDLMKLSGVGDLAKLEALRAENERLLALAEGGKTEHERVMEIIAESKKEKEDLPIREAKLADFLKIDYRQHGYEETLEAVNDGLQVNFKIKLYRESFLIIERAILHRKISKIYNANKVVMINCIDCGDNLAVVYCPDCEDHFCQSCFDTFHNKSKAYKSHEKVNILLNPTGIIPAAPKQSSVASTSRGNGGSATSLWKKFEYFNFPIPETNHKFDSLRVHYGKLKQAYIDYNYIDAFSGAVDYAAVFVDQNYDCIERQMAREMKQQHKKQFGRKALTALKETVEGVVDFNEEELFYLNRLMFRLIKKKGPLVQFDKWVKDITTLQSGPIEERLKLWLNCVCEMEEDITLSASGKSVKNNETDLNLSVRAISKTKFSNVVRASFPQDVTMRTNLEAVVDKIYSNGLDDSKQIDKLHAVILKDPEALTLLSAVLQYEDESVQEGGL